ncbi:hypothetical protein ACFCY8_21285 [Streptomyces noursei]|uniref:hypothetical protein n=1 Tax=Streptomyces noursei TaxID=1971 RepID=UPI0035E3342F
MTHSAGPPPRDRSRLNLWHWLKPKSSRALIFGLIMGPCGLIGGVRSVVNGMPISTSLGLLGLGLLGLLIVVGYFVNHDR